MSKYVCNMTVETATVTERHEGTFTEPTVTIHYSASLMQQEVFDTLTKNNPHYILIGIFIKNHDTHIFYSDAKRHNELRVAVEDREGLPSPFDLYDPGFGYLDEQKRITSISFSQRPGDDSKEAEENISILLRKINHRFFKEGKIPISWGELGKNRPWEHIERYFYFPLTEKLESAESLKHEGIPSFES